jgi:putative hemolysin
MIAWSMGMPVAISIAMLAVGLAASALLSGLETGIYVLNKVRLELRGAAGELNARRLRKAMARPQELLTSVLIGINAANYLVTIAVVALFSLTDTDNADLYAVAVATPVLFVFGEMVPKNLFRIAAETWPYRLAPLLTAMMKVCRVTGISPALAGLNRLMLHLLRPDRHEVSGPLDSRQRVQRFLAEGHAHGVLTAFQSHMASRVVLLRTTVIRDVMVALHHVVSIPLDCSRARFIENIKGHHYSRLVVWSERPRSIVGTVDIYDVLYDDDPTAAPAKHLAEAVRLSEALNVADALIALQRSRQTLGVVVNVADRPIGIVTIKDLVEEIVGELEEW